MHHGLAAGGQSKDCISHSSTENIKNFKHEQLGVCTKPQKFSTPANGGTCI